MRNEKSITVLDAMRYTARVLRMQQTRSELFQQTLKRKSHEKSFLKKQEKTEIKKSESS
jgi:hypothetical protein